MKHRVELHAHTNLSAMDGVDSAEILLRRAAALGMKALAVTDHGVVQAFPEMQKTVDAIRKEGGDFKAIYGCETYFVDDLIPVVYGNGTEPLDGEFVVFDAETTGRNAHTDRLVKIVAVRVKGAKVAERFETLVNPGRSIPDTVAHLTEITDELVKDAPDEQTALAQFLAFAGDNLLVAYNASFVVPFLHAAAQRASVAVGNPYADVALLAQKLLPELPNRRLDRVAKALGLADREYARLHDDAERCARIFLKLLERLHEQTGCDDLFACLASLPGGDPEKILPYHQILLARNATGLKNLYKLVSMAHLDYFYNVPRIPKSELVNHRDGLLVGSGCEQGELFRAILANQPWDRLCEIAGFYDFLEIQPLGNTLYLLQNGVVQTEEQLRDCNRTVVRLGNALGIPVCATGNAHYCAPEDGICRRILREAQGFPDADEQPPLHLRTTEEMLTEFAYLAEETAYAVVVENPNRIADAVEPLRPVPEGFFPPQTDGAEERLQALVRENAKERYGDPLPAPVQTRLEKELSQIAEHGYAGIYLTAQLLAADSERQGYRVLSRGSVGASLVAHLAGITEVNPLPPHYCCPHCRYTEFPSDGEVGSGFDLPKKACPRCGADLNRDGQEIPVETFLGLNGEKTPDIDLNLAPAYLPAAYGFLQARFGKAHVLRPGIVRTISPKSAEKFVRRYAEKHALAPDEAEIMRLANRLTGVKCGSGQHPGGWILLPADSDAEDFTAVQRADGNSGGGDFTAVQRADGNSGGEDFTAVQRAETNSDEECLVTHFDFHSLSGLFKLDLPGHAVPAIYRELERSTGVPVEKAPLCDPEVYSLLTSPKALGVTPEEIDCETGTLGLPELETAFVRQMLTETQPKNFADLMKISGLSHGAGTWTGNAQTLLAEKTCSLPDVIALRDDVLLYLTRKGVPTETAFAIMESVRKGRARRLPAEVRRKLLDGGVSERYLDSCEKIRYLFPKAHAAAYMMAAVRLGWYKIRFPAAFYAACFHARFGAATEDERFDLSVLWGGAEEIRRSFAAPAENPDDDPFSERDLFYRLAYEAARRGVSFQPADSTDSRPSGFYAENGAIRVVCPQERRHNG